MSAEKHLSPQSINALAEIISGGSAYDPTPPIGLYRTAHEIEKFMRSCNVEFQIGNASRVPTLEECLIKINNKPDGFAVMQRLIERAADPRDFIREPERHSEVIDHLNQYLSYDDLELKHHGKGVRLCSLGRSSAVIDHLSNKVDVLDFDTVSRDLERALDSCDKDPEDAITSACSTVESVCRSILVELDEDLPPKKDISGLYKAVREPLGLSPKREDVPALIANDVKKVLSGLGTTVEGIGSLRTHGGDAHGRERKYGRIDGRIARLAIHSASTLALFLIETWERKYPNMPLNRHD